WVVLPPVMEYYYAQLHPEYKILPPFAPNCLQEGEKLMAFIYPKKNETVLLPKNFDENVTKSFSSWPIVRQKPLFFGIWIQNISAKPKPFTTWLFRQNREYIY